MTTAIETVNDPFRQSTSEYDASGLDLPVGAFKLRLVGNMGKGQSTSEGSKALYLNLRFKAVRRGIYAPDTSLLVDREGEEIPRNITFFQKFYVTKRDGSRNDFGIEQLNSWLHSVDYDTKGTFNPATNLYDFDLDEALSATIDKEAWTYVTHKDNPPYGLQMNLDLFEKKPRYRLKTNGATS